MKKKNSFLKNSIIAQLYRIKAITSFCLIFISCTVSISILANPVVNNVAAGNVSIQQTPNSTVINQSSGKAIINWKSFNINQGETTHFEQLPGGIALNRIDPKQGVSEIYGTLTATGKIILINPAGIYFGPTAYVNVGGLIATVANLSDKDFLNDHYQFTNVAGYSGSIINAGQIIAAHHGLIALVGAGVSNTGYIQANLGKIILASGSEFTVDFNNDNLINFAITSPTSSAGVDQNGNKLKSAVSNTGSLIANGGKILVAAKTAENILDNAINMQGIAQAKSFHQQQGEIIFDGGENGNVQISGSITASGNKAGQHGGTVKILGNNIEVDHASIDVSGEEGGGVVLIGGNARGAGPEPNANYTYVGSDTTIHADALTSGDGGKIVVWANDAAVAYGNYTARGGIVSGNGGSVETSAPSLDVSAIGTMDLSASHGAMGTWLLDPANVTINDSATASINYSGGTWTPGLLGVLGVTLNAGDLGTKLNTSNVEVVTTDVLGLGTGTITFSDPSNALQTNWGSASTALTLQADAGITFNSNLTLNGTGKTLNLIAGNTTAASNVVLNNTMDGSFALNITSGSSGSVTIGAALGSTTALSSLSVTGASGININTSTISTTGAQTYNNAVTLGTSSALTGDTISMQAVALGANNLSINTTSTTSAITGIVSGTGNFTKLGIGTLTLSGINTYGGITTLTAGILKINADSGLGTAPNSVIANALTFAGGTLETTANFTLNANRGITLNTGGGGITTDNNTTLVYNGIITGSNAFTKDGAGALNLNDINTYTGATTINAGTLNLNNAAALGSGVTQSSDLTVMSGATLNLGFNGALSNTNSLTLNGNGVGSAGALTLNGANNTITNAITLTSSSLIGGAGTGLVTFGSAISGTSSNLTINLNNANISLPAISLTTAGSLGVTTTSGSITQTGGISIPDSLSLTAGNAITLNQTNSTSNADGTISILANQSNSANNFNLASGGSLTTTGGINASVTIDVNNGGAVGTGAAIFTGSITTNNAPITVVTNFNGNTTGGSITATGTSPVLISGTGNITLAVPTASTSSIGAPGNAVDTGSYFPISSSGTLTLTTGSGGAWIWDKASSGTLTLASPTFATSGAPFTLYTSNDLTLPTATLNTGTGYLDIVDEGPSVLNVTNNLTSNDNEIQILGVNGVTIAADTIINANGGGIVLWTNASNSTLTLGSGVQVLTAANIGLVANNITFNGSGTLTQQIGGTASGTGSANDIAIDEATPLTAFSIGSTCTTAAPCGSGLQLSQAMLNTLRSSDIRFGDGSSGLITIAGVSTSYTFGNTYLSFDSGAGIMQTGALILGSNTGLILRAAGNITLNNASNLITNIVDSQSSGALSVTNSATQPLTVTSLTDDVGTINGINAPNGVVLNTTGVGGLLTINQNINTTNNAITLSGTGILQAANISVNAGSGNLSYNAGSGSTTLNTNDQLFTSSILSLIGNGLVLNSLTGVQIGGTAIGVGNATNAILTEGTAGTTIGVAGGLGSLSLSQAELNTIRTANMRIGDSNAGAVTIAAFSPTLTSASGVLTLDSGAGITQTGVITTTNLLLRGIGDDVLNSNNVLTNLSAALTSGSVKITNAATQPLIINSLTDDIGTVNGITAPNGVELNTSGTGGSLTINQNINSASNNGNITLNSVGITETSNVSLNAGNGTISLNAGSDTLTLNNGSALLSTGIINLTADNMTFDTSVTPSQIGGSNIGVGSASNVILQESTAGRSIGIAGGSGNLSFSQSVLNDIRTTDLRIGNNNAGTMTIGTWTPSATLATNGVVTLDTAGNIVETGVINLSVDTASLLIRNANQVTLNQNNVLSKIASSIAGNLALTSTSALTVSNLSDDIGSVAGISATNGVIMNATNAAITLNANVNANVAGNAIVLTGGSFINNQGASALNPGGGDFLVWSGNPANDNRGGIAYNFKQYNATYGSTTILGSGNGFLYQLAPLITPELSGVVSKTYDSTTTATLSNINYTNSGTVDGDIVNLNNPSSGIYANANVGNTINVSVSGLAIVNAVNSSANVYGYQLSSTSTNANIGIITPASITISSNAGLTKVYGTNDPISIESAYSITSGTLFGTDTLTGNMGRVAGESVGSYNFTQNTVGINDGNGGNNYTLTFNGTINKFQITPAPLTASIGNQNKTYGTNDPAISGITVTLGNIVNTNVSDINGNITAINDTGLVSASLASLTRTIGEDVGTESITGASFHALTGSAAGNYTLANQLSNTPSLSITAQPLSATIANQTKVYGADDPSLAGINVNLSGVIDNANINTWNGIASVNDTGLVSASLASLTRTIGENVGTESITGASFHALTGSAAGNYTLANQLSNTPSLSITAQPLSATIANQTKVYGADDPSLAGINVNLSGVIDNANINTWNGIASVNDTGLVSASLASLTRTIGEDVGTESITGASFHALTGSAAGNYTLANQLSNTPSLSITAQPLSATIANQTKVYGADDPSLAGINVNLSGVIDNANINTWNGIASVNDTGLVSASLASLTRTIGEDVGTESITGASFHALTGSAAGNYTLANQLSNTPSLSITAQPLSATIANQTKVYGADDPSLAGINVNLSGVIDNANINTWNGIASVNDTGLVSASLASLTRTIGEDVGTESITGASFHALTGSAAGNYTLANQLSNTPSLSITAQPLSATIANQTKVYGADDPSLAGINVNLSGVIDNANINTWNGIASVNDTGLVSASLASLTRTIGENVGTESITGASFHALTGSAAGNYTLANQLSNTPSLSITAQPLSATIINPSIVEGDPDPAASNIAVMLNGVVDNLVHTWNGNVNINDTNQVGISLTSLTRVQGESVNGSPYLYTSEVFNTLSGAAASNYNAPVALSGTPELFITPAPIVYLDTSNNVATSNLSDPPSLQSKIVSVPYQIVFPMQFNIPDLNISDDFSIDEWTINTYDNCVKIGNYIEICTGMSGWKIF